MFACRSTRAGAAITDKARIESLQPAVLASCAQHLRQAQEGSHNTRFLVVHGAGSFGHRQVGCVAGFAAEHGLFHECAHACVRAWVRGYVRACVRACSWVLQLGFIGASGSCRWARPDFATEWWHAVLHGCAVRCGAHGYAHVYPDLTHTALMGVCCAQAKEGRVTHGPLTDPAVKHAYARTRAAVTKLNSLVVSALVEAGKSLRE